MPDHSPSVRITTGSRLHFGLLDTAPPFGGCGVMIDQPGAIVVATPAADFSYTGPHCDRVSRIARRLRGHWQTPQLPACRIDIPKSPPPHSGLGSGTQMSLAITESISIATQRSLTHEQIIDIADRGHRSAVGVHGYFQGGFIAEGVTINAGVANKRSVNMIHQRIELSSRWHAVVLIPKTTAGSVAGDTESRHFAGLNSAPVKVRQQLARLIVEEICPAAASGDFARFADHVTEYNRQSGNLFAKVQGGPYNGPWVTELIETAIQNGGRGVGQSSWGPGVFAWFSSHDEAKEFVLRVGNKDCNAIIIRASNRPRKIEQIGQPS